MRSSPSPEDERRLRLRIVRQIAVDVAQVIATVELSEIDGNVHLPKPSLVSALSRYFDEAGGPRRVCRSLLWQVAPRNRAVAPRCVVQLEERLSAC